MRKHQIILLDDFVSLFGREPVDDELERVNCSKADTFGSRLGHTFCGWCETCHLPRIMCGHPRGGVKYLYSFCLWPYPQAWEKMDVVIKYKDETTRQELENLGVFKVLQGRIEVVATSEDFGILRVRLGVFGFDMHEIERVPMQIPEFIE